MSMERSWGSDLTNSAFSGVIAEIREQYGDVVRYTGEKVTGLGWNPDLGKDWEIVQNNGLDNGYFLSNPIDRICSSDNTDTMSMLVIGNSFGGSAFSRQDMVVQLQGHTPVALPQNVAFAAFLVPLGPVPFAGDVYVFEDGPTTNGVPDDLSSVALQGDPFHQRSLKAAGIIDADRYVHIDKVSVGVHHESNSARDVQFMLQSQTIGGVLRTIDMFDCNTRAGGTEFTLDHVFPPNSYVRLVAKSSGNSTIVHATFRGHILRIIP